MRRASLVTTLIISAICCSAETTLAEPFVEKYLREGKLADGEAALRERLQKEPQDDEARFGLGFVQFLRGIENFGRSLHRYGLRTERAFGGTPRDVRELFPQNPNPEKVSYAAFRGILQTWLDDLDKAKKTLAAVKDPAVKLPLHVGTIKLDLFGQSRPVDAALLFGQAGAGVPKEDVEKFVVTFDRGDANWLAGYCHILSAWCEVLLAVDGGELFDSTAHLFFEKVDSPHVFLQEEVRALEGIIQMNRPVISDVIAFIHLWRFPMKEPARMQRALSHLESALANAREMWKHYQAETDDDREWIPNPKQTGVLPVPVTEDIMQTWLVTLDEVESVLQGKTLIPFWRGNHPNRGVNLRRVFTEPRTIDPILWFQGTAATPYLENGTLTKFVDPQMLARMNRSFGGIRFIGFAFWFN